MRHVRFSALAIMVCVAGLALSAGLNIAEAGEKYRSQHVQTSQAETIGQIYFRQAEEAFRTRKYDQAVRLARHASVEMRQNGRVFLFLSQSALAVGNYREAAQAARKGMSKLGQRQWGWLVRNFRRYYSNKDYVKQVKKLEKFSRLHPNHADAQFLLGYHYGYLGYPSVASGHLVRVQELGKSDAITARLLVHFQNKVGPAPRPSVLAPKVK